MSMVTRHSCRNYMAGDTAKRAALREVRNV